MTIDEAIAREKSRANLAKLQEELFLRDKCMRNAKESHKSLEHHGQIAEWLEELKAYRENYTSYIMEDIEVTQNAMYNKAIYDFAIALKNNFEDLPLIISKESFLDFINDNADLLIRGK